MAGEAQPVENQELVEVLPSRSILQETAARLYGQGFPRSTVAKMLLDHLAPNQARPHAYRMRRARNKLRMWEGQQNFRDLLYVHAVKELDMQTPAILKGIASKAKRGRVDAARLALELTGRHNPKGDQQPAQVAVIISGVPRPAIAQQPADGTVVIEANEAMIAEDEDI